MWNRGDIGTVQVRKFSLLNCLFLGIINCVIRIKMASKIAVVLVSIIYFELHQFILTVIIAKSGVLLKIILFYIK